MTRLRSRSRGFTLLETVLAVLILATGLLACTGLIVVGMAGNTRNQNDSGGTLLAQMVLEQINTMPAGSGLNITMTDCAGSTWTVKTTPAPQPNGAGAATDPTFRGIDFTQPKSSVPAGYQMDYVMCASQQARRATYDVRWNIASLSSNTNLITVSARHTATADGQAIIYSRPVTLRTIQGL